MKPGLGMQATVTVARSLILHVHIVRFHTYISAFYCIHIFARGMPEYI